MNEHGANNSIMHQPRRIDGQNVFYHYIQKNLLKDDSDVSKELLKRFLLDMSIWIPINFYKRLPVILPYVVRDSSCRGRPNGEDEWGKADKSGFLRDDNSLIKGIPRSFIVESSQVEYYDGLKMGNGFVASHIWGKIMINGNQFFSSRLPELNSFIPNLTWLPVQLSKLTDRQDSFAQRFLQAVSYKIYYKIAMPVSISKIWNNLLFPSEFRDLDIDISKVSFFKVPDEWLVKRIHNLTSEIDLISSVTKKTSTNAKIKCHRYLQSLVQLSDKERAGLNKWLSDYKSIIKDSSFE
jgi:hypothetical protein